MSTRDQAEFRLQCVVVDYLRRAIDVTACFWTSIEHGGWRTPATAQRMVRVAARPGLPDLWFVLGGGKTVAIELKTEGGVLSPEQEKIHAWLRALDVSVYVAETLDGVAGALRREGVPLRFLPPPYEARA